MDIYEDTKQKHNKLREILLDYECEEIGDALIDEICDVFGCPRTTLFEDGKN